MKNVGLRNYRKGESAATLKYLGWDSGIYGFKIGRIEKIRLIGSEKANIDLVKKILIDCRKAGYRHVNCRIGIKDFAALRALERNGFNIADIQITLSTPARPRKRRVALPGFRIAKAAEEDLGQIKDITRDAFTDTRFARDLNYPREKVDEFYCGWVKNSICNSRQAVFLGRDNRTGKAVGFVICGKSDKTGFIDLISVSRVMRGMGIGRALVTMAMNWFSDSCDAAEVRTQISNVAAISTFMKCGFDRLTIGRVLPSGISLHYWFGDRA